MAYTTPSTQPTGTLITSTHYKAHIIDNIKFLHGPPTARARRSAATSPANNTWTSVAFDTEDFDTNTIWSSTAATKFKVATAGKYLVCFSAGWNTSTAGSRSIGISKSATGTTPTEATVFLNQKTAGDRPCLAVSCIVALTTSQFISGNVWQNSGGGLQLSTVAGEKPNLSMLWVSS